MSNMRFGRLNLVDLAGSERYDMTLLDANIVYCAASESLLW